MAWPYGGEWEGLGTDKMAEIVSALCVAINERQFYSTMSNITDEYEGVESTWEYAGVARPAPEDFSGLVFNSNQHKTLIQSMVTRINTLVFPTGKWVKDVSDIWEGDSLDFSKNHCFYTNLMIIRRALDHLIKTRQPISVTGSSVETWSDEESWTVYESDVAGLWSKRTEATFPGFGYLGSKQFVVGAGIVWRKDSNALCYSRIGTEYSRTFESGKYLGKLDDCPIAVNAVESRATLPSVSQTANASFEYLVNGNPVDVSSVGWLSEDIPIATDVTVDINMITEPDYTGSLTVSFMPTLLDIWDVAAELEGGLTGEFSRWVFNMSTLLTDQS